MMALYVLICFLLVFVYTTVNLFYKVEALEMYAEELQNSLEDSIGFIEEINNRLSRDYAILKDVDRRGSFESDDEVGFVFKTIYVTVQDSYEFINKTYKKLDDKTEEEEEEEKE